VVYQGAKSKVFTNQNASVAQVSGVTFFGKIKFFNWWQIAGQVTYTRGTTKQKEQFVPMDHIQPLTGKCGITYDKGRVTTSLDLLFNGVKPLKLYAPNGEDNAQYAAPNGMPAWMDLRWNLNYMFRPNIGLQLGVNNILDHRYRVFASGVNAPGRSIWFKLSLGL
jgi:hemoglobin/transferrin/lactoferrin receptor protein